MRSKNYVLSPSKVEQYRLYRDGEMNEFITKESVVDTIMGVKTFTTQMNFGTAYHEMLEHGVEPYYVGPFYEVQVESQKFWFNGEHVQPIVDFRAQHPDVTYECKLGFTITLGKLNIRVRSRVDGLEGNVIHEFKTSSRKIDVARFERSCQWKMYCLGIGAKCVQYNTFKYKAKDDELISVEPLDFRFYRNEGTDHQLFALLNDFIEFCYIEGIEHKIIDEL